MSKAYIDIESVGFHGVPVLLQYAIDDGEVILHDIWREPMGKTLDLIEMLCEHKCILFNAVFDWFHISKIYTMFRLYNDRDAYPDGHVHELGIIEEQARFSNICVKPKSCHDVMLHARKTKYQSLMERDPIVIRRVPTVLAYELAKELEKLVKFDKIYFAKQKDPLAPKWRVFDVTRTDGTIDKNFKNVKLRFRASTGLKNLYRHAFKIEDSFYSFADIALDKRYNPEEVGFAPYAMALAPNVKVDGDWHGTWPAKLQWHTAHWYYNQNARKYSANDVRYTRRLYQEEFGSPEPGDVDSELAIMVAASRWHGFAIDLEKMIGLKRNCLINLGFDDKLADIYKMKTATPSIISKFGKAVIAAAPSKRYMLQAMNAQERLGFQGSTKKIVLEHIANSGEWVNDDGTEHLAAIRAREILQARKAKKSIEVFEKLIQARRFHASFKITGALSNRMSGADGLNPQGVDHQTEIRSAFPLADSSCSVLQSATGLSEADVVKLLDAGELQITKLSGGDFSSFEVSLAARVFDDPKLNDFLEKGGKIHAVFAMRLFPGKTYEQILATSGAKDTRDLYDVGKKCLFAIFYGAEAYTLMDRQGIPEEIAVAAVSWLQREYRGILIFGEKIKRDFGALAQPAGVGTKVEWVDPKEYIESFLGFKRYFTLENRVMKALFELAQKVPKSWRGLQIKVQRRERIQTPSGAVASSLYGAAFGIQSRTIRAAKNHCIQSPGATITKALQNNVWTLQPCGVHAWVVQSLNVHDEVLCCVAKGYEEAVKAKAKETVAQYKKIVPQLKLDWLDEIKNWGAKKG